MPRRGIASASARTDSRRCGYRPISTSRRCSTVSTSAYRPTRWSSAHASSTGWSTSPDPPREARGQYVRATRMILRRMVTRRRPSGKIRSRASSQPPYSAASVSKRRTVERESVRETQNRLISYSMRSLLTAIGDVVERRDDLIGKLDVLDRQRALELSRRAGSDDSRADTRAVTYPRERDLRRRQLQAVGGAYDRFDDPTRRSAQIDTDEALEMRGG